VDVVGWRERFEELRRAHAVPGASLAVLADGRVQAVATGVLNTGTGVEATTDSLFQIGSITKVYTATAVMQLVEQGLTTLDTPVVEIVPEFRVADAEVTARVNLRHLLAHTSGINGDPTIDAGRGDDCLARFVEGCAGVTQCHPLGDRFSYCNAGYSILGRVIERLTGRFGMSPCGSWCSIRPGWTTPGRCPRMCCGSAPRWAIWNRMASNARHRRGGCPGSMARLGRCAPPPPTS
jgi:CubicO group peptidase (beta-lactamase class C family)